MFDSLKNALTGARIISDWVGHGLQPVSASVAQSRGDICTGRNGIDAFGPPCPFNLSSAGASITGEVAQAVKEQMEKKNEMKCEVIGEEKLFTCDICLCHLPLKIWCPPEHYLPHTPKSVLSDFSAKAPWCWQLSESHQQQAAK